MRSDNGADFTKQEPGIKHGISGGQWEQRIDLSEADHDDNEEEQEKFTCVGSSSSVGREELEFLSIAYSKDALIRLEPAPTLKDLDDSMFIFFCSKSLAEKVQAVHLYSNGYKLQELTELSIDESEFQPNVPVIFSEDELSDPWVRIRPANRSSAFHLRFFEATPTRLFSPEQVKNSLSK